MGDPLLVGGLGPGTPRAPPKSGPDAVYSRHIVVKDAVGLIKALSPHLISWNQKNCTKLIKNVTADAILELKMHKNALVTYILLQTIAAFFISERGGAVHC